MCLYFDITLASDLLIRFNIFRELCTLLAARNVAVFLISGGFHTIVDHIATELGIPLNRVFANRLLFDSSGKSIFVHRLVRVERCMCDLFCTMEEERILAKEPKSERIQLMVTVSVAISFTLSISNKFYFGIGIHRGHLFNTHVQIRKGSW